MQLLDVVDPRLLFEHYVYVSGTSPSFVRHFEEYSDFVAKLTGLPRGALVVDIGSNDGTLLRAFEQRHGARVLGIDPARNLAEAATKAGIETLPEFFTATLAEKLASERGKASVITANNVFAHVDDLGGVVDGVRSLLAPDGVFVFEVSYLLDVVGDILFDTIYHEHLAYHAVRPLIPFFERHGMELIEAVRVPTHGGSLRGIAQLRGGPRRRGASVADALALEQKAGLEKLATYQALAGRINALGRKTMPSRFIRFGGPDFCYCLLCYGARATRLCARSSSHLADFPAQSLFLWRRSLCSERSRQGSDETASQPLSPYHVRSSHQRLCLSITAPLRPLSSP